MSGQCYGWVLRNGPKPDDLDRDGNPYGLERARAMRAVLGVIADAANTNGEHSHPGSGFLSEASLYSAGYVRRVVAILVANGWLEIEEEGGGRGRATVYRVVMVERKRAPKPAPQERFEDETRASDPVNARTADPKRAPVSEKPAHGTPSDQPVRDANGLYNGKDSTVKNNVLDFAQAEPNDFDAFWSIYPLKAAKETARRAFAKAAKKVPVEVLIAGAQRYRDDPHRVAQFTKHPATWLNGGCWSDAPLPSRTGGKRDPNAGVNQIVRRMEAKYGGDR